MAKLRQAGVTRGSLVGLAVAPGTALGLAAGAGAWAVLAGTGPDPARELIAPVGRVARELRPRWVLWSSETAATLVAGQVRLATCWDIAAVHRLLAGGWRADPGRA